MTRPSLSRVFAALQLGIARKKMPFYAVARGNKPGIYQTWAECQESINGYARARYKKFATEAEAKEFVQENSLTCPTVDRRETSKKAEDNGAPPSSPPVQKRKHESESEEEGDEDRPSSSKKLNAEGKEGDKTKFKVDSDGFLIVYTDGSCWMNGKQGAKAGMGVFFGQDHPLNVAEPIKGRPTNNNAEIQAATCALELAKSAGFSKVAVHTDSQFMIDCASSWMKNWKKKGWVKSDGQPVKNKEELMVLDSAMDDLAVKWVHVKAHAGHEGNEEADKLARQGGKQYKSEA
ncbi:ribonuclease H1-like isoform X2 [Portunus trituberculatus]|uniref:ribonuclease H1-like isoform X2 n=1 Tax=Portunus trituberculatus TaxID=210409 RepID=UPI001E1CF260|nr:ribonuclease H1-like isoform X2 [Portunus trituberculatus]